MDGFFAGQTQMDKRNVQQADPQEPYGGMEIRPDLRNAQDALAFEPGRLTAAP